MISTAITVLRPTAPGVAPGTALPAGPVGPASTVPGPVGPQGPQGPVGAQGPGPTQAQINAAVAAFLATPGAVSQLLASLPTSLPTGGGAFLDNGIVTVA